MDKKIIQMPIISHFTSYCYREIMPVYHMFNRVDGADLCSGFGEQW